MSESKSEVLSQRTQKVLALFENELRDVRFPDVDAEILEALVQHVWEAQAEVEQAERALEAVRARRAGHVEALDGVVQKALAYARVFSENDSPLRERISDIDREHGGVSVAASAGKRGRPKKRSLQSDVGSDLFATEDGLGEAADGQPTLM